MEGDWSGTLLFATAGGLVKRSALADYQVRKGRFAAIALKGQDRLAALVREDGQEQVMLVTRKAMAIHFALEEVPVTGRATSGVKGIALAPEDQVIACFLHDCAGELLIATDRASISKRCFDHRANIRAAFYNCAFHRS